MKINEITNYLESLAPLYLQEDYDNSGFITGNKSWNVSNVLVCLDCTEEVVDEAIAKSCNLIVAHHPIVFSGLKSIIGKNYVERTIISVGNLCAGGSGKSPLAEYILRLIDNRDKVAVLSRGYGRDSTGFHWVTNKSFVKDVGDEPLQIARKFPEINVAVSESRNKGCLL